ncbi:hypothetical protein ACWKWK_09590 [Pseudoxanthomonas beigongshangi]
MAELLNDYFTAGWRERRYECACGWQGDSRAMQMDLQDEVTDYACPDCGNLLLIVRHPDLAQVRAAAAAGHPEARQQLALLEEAERLLGPR